MKFSLSLIPLALLLVSCVTYRLEPLAQAGVDIRQGRDQSWATVKGESASVEASALLAPEIRFEVKVTNTSNKTLTIDSNRFRFYAGNTKQWDEVRMISSEDYYQRAEKDALEDQVIITYSEAPSYRQTTTTIGNGGNSSVTIVRTQREPVLQSTRVAGSISSNEQRYLDRLKDTLFYTRNLEPGQSFSGVVYGDYVRDSHFKLVVPVDGKDYEIVFERVREKGPFINLP